MPNNVITLICTVFFCTNIFSQSLTLEDIFLNNKYALKNVEDFQFQEDNKYTQVIKDVNLKSMSIIEKDFDDKNHLDTLVNGKILKELLGYDRLNIHQYSLLQEGVFLLSLNGEQQYRHSQKYYFVLYITYLNKAIQINPQKAFYVDISPDGRYFSYVMNDNIYLFDIKKLTTKQITKSGKKNALQHGSADWMYEEEFQLTQAYQWSPDGSKIAYLTFDISELEEFVYTQDISSSYPEVVAIKYPKAGTPITKVSLNIYDLKKKKTYQLPIEKDNYLPQIFWKNNKELAYLQLNRLQNNMDIIIWNGSKNRTIYNETSNTFLELPILCTFNNYEDLLISSRKSGYTHLYKMNKNNTTAITQGDYNVTAFLGYNQEDSTIMYQSNERSQVDKSIYKINIFTNEKKCLTPYSGTYSIENWGENSMVMSFSSIYTPNKYYLIDYEGKIDRILVDNDTLANILPTPIQFFYIEEGNLRLSSYYILPPDYDSSKTYPLLVYCYGGPHGEEVTNEWKGNRDLYLYYMAQQGYIVACTDNRGVGNIRNNYNTSIYRNLGQNEVEDQVKLVNILKERYNIDTATISIFGWSYGGYLAGKCLLDRPDVFKKAVVVAPVTDWRYYDAAYTERYMGLPSENLEGYKKSSLIDNTYKLQGRLLLIHGTADDNVHFQNTLAWIQELQKQKKNFTLQIYPDKNHNIGGTFARYHLFTTISEFLKH